MSYVKIEIEGNPIGKQRARHGPYGFYTPKNTAAWEKMAGAIAKKAMIGKKILKEPVSLCIIARFEIPKTWPKWKKKLAVAGCIKHTGKPDADNIIKILCDSMNGIVYEDDCYVDVINIHKLYCSQGEKSLLRVFVYEEGGYPSQIKTNPKT